VRVNVAAPVVLSRTLVAGKRDFDGKCVLIDAGADRLSDDDRGRFIDYLKGLDVQVILTTAREDISISGAKTFELGDSGLRNLGVKSGTASLSTLPRNSPKGQGRRDARGK
jgi:hypothetical protein